MRLLLILFFFLPIYCHGQDSSVIVHKIDSIWSIKIKTKKEKFKSSGDGIQYRVWYNKKTRDIILVEEIHYPVENEETKFWIYYYHFRDGKLIFITKYNNAGIKNPGRKVCYYYFRDDNLIYKHEFRTSISNIETEREKAYDLKIKFAKS